MTLYKNVEYKVKQNRYENINKHGREAGKKGRKRNEKRVRKQREEERKREERISGKEGENREGK